MDEKTRGDSGSFEPLSPLVRTIYFPTDKHEKNLTTMNENLNSFIRMIRGVGTDRIIFRLTKLKAHHIR